MNAIVGHNQARKQIKLLPVKYRKVIHARVDQLAKFPDCQGLDIKELHGHRHGFRLRVGRYRVLFDFDNGIRIIAIQEVKKRDERTY